jgi:hypothetical protein
MVEHTYSNGKHNEMPANASYPTSQYQQKSRQPPSAPRSSVPQIPGKDDLEKLENLKRIIKSGQHEFYRAIPQPEALAKLYMGVLPSSVPGDSEDGQKKGPVNPEQSLDTKQLDTSSTSPTSPTDSSRRPPRYHNKDTTDAAPRKPSISNGSSQVSAIYVSGSSYDRLISLHRMALLQRAPQVSSRDKFCRKMALLSPPLPMLILVPWTWNQRTVLTTQL